MQKSFEKLIQTAVDSKLSPGIIAVAFNRKELVAQTAKGVRTLGAQDPATLSSTVWMASMSKAVTATVCLAIVEELGFDIDSHEELVKYVPEVGKAAGNDFWKIFDGRDESGAWKYKDATVPCTLRHFLTHTSGVPYHFNSASRSWYYAQHPKMRSNNRKLKYLFGPRDCEAGERWLYGESCEVYGLFATRATGKTWRELLKEYIYNPLNIPAGTLDCFREPGAETAQAQMDLKHRAEDGTFTPFDIPINGYKGEVPAEEYEYAGGFLWGQVPSYARFAQGLLNGLSGVLSKQMFERATQDDLQLRGLSIYQDGTEPVLHAVDPRSLAPIYRWNSPHPTLGWTLLNTLYNRADADCGIHAGTLQWAGIANSFYFVDPVAGVGGVFACMSMPFVYPGMDTFREAFEAWVVQNVTNEAGASESESV